MHSQFPLSLLAHPHLEFAVLVGSRTTGNARPNSDWDIALQWSPKVDWMTTLGLTETLRSALAEALCVAPSAIDLIDLRRANLAMRASVAEEGVPLYGKRPWLGLAFYSEPGVSWRIFTGRKLMRLDLYQAETARIAAEQSALLEQAKLILRQGIIP